MTKYVKTLLQMHLKYVWVYLLLAICFFLAYYMSLFFSFLLSFAISYMGVIHIITSFTFAVIWSAPLLLPNYQAAKKHVNLTGLQSFQESAKSVTSVTLWNQLITIIPLFIISFIYLKNQVGEF